MSYAGAHLIVPGLREADLTDPVKSIEDAQRADPAVTVIDLEDGVGPDMKERARETTTDLLAEWAGDGRTYAVRINGLESSHAIRDIEALVDAPAPPSAVVLPEVRSGEDVRAVSQLFEAADAEMGILPLLERPRAIFNAQDIANASPRVEALVFGSVDFRRYMGMSTMDQTPDLSLPRYVVSMAASGADVAAIDTVYLHREDMEGLRREARDAKAVGFDGKLATDVTQVEPIAEAFAPSAEEVAHAERIVSAFEDAGDDTGLITVDGTTVDKPIVDEQRALLERAREAGFEVDDGLGLSDM